MDAEEMKKYEEAVRDVIGMHAIVLGRGGAGYVEFDAWLAAHDAEVQAQVVAEEPSDDEREDMIAFLLRDHNFEESPWGRTYTDAEIANALRRSEVPEPRRRMPKRLVNQLRRASGALEEYEFEGVAGDAPGLMNSAADLIEREWGSRPEPQGEPSDAQEAIRVASPDTWDWDACVVCGSKDVTDRGMMVLFSAKDGVYVSRVAWCDQSQECRDDLRQAGASMLTDQDAKSIDAALRAAGGVR